MVRTMFILRSMFNVSIVPPILKYTNHQGKEQVLKEAIIHKIRQWISINFRLIQKF